MYNLINTYNFISETLGSKSPAKVAAQEEARAAAFEAALRELTRTIVSAETINDVLDGVTAATKGTSKVPGLLSTARTTDDMKFVFENLNDPANVEIARALASAVLNATGVDAVA